MKKFIEVNGEKMDAVEFTRFIRGKTSPKIDRLVKEVLDRERKNDSTLKRLQKVS